MQWDELEEHLRADGFSLAAIAYARRRYHDFGKNGSGWELEPSSATFVHFQELARAYDAALTYPEECTFAGRCYEPRLDARTVRWFRKCADGCGCPCHVGQVWLAQGLIVRFMGRVASALGIRIPPLVTVERNVTPGKESVTVGAAPNEGLASAEFGCGLPRERPIFAKRRNERD